MTIPADAAVARTEELLHDASGDTWAGADLLKILGMLYAYLGRAADARAAIDRSQSVVAGLGARLALAECAIMAGWVGLTVGDPVAAERDLRAGYEAVHATGEQYYLANMAIMLAIALYEQGRFDEAAQMIEEPRGETASFFAEVAALTKAKLLARRGQFAAARRLADEVETMLSPTASPLEQATVHEARAEIERLAGAPGEATARLRAALRIYEDRRATALAERPRIALARLAAQPCGDPL